MNVQIYAKVSTYANYELSNGYVTLIVDCFDELVILTNTMQSQYIFTMDPTPGAVSLVPTYGLPGYEFETDMQASCPVEVYKTVDSSNVEIVDPDCTLVRQTDTDYDLSVLIDHGYRKNCRI